jgi:PHS family inorganic phosphate transporter-like MFS transporter
MRHRPSSRFFLLGLGGIYPLSATKAAEDSASAAHSTNSSGSAIAFFWQIPGTVSPWLFSFILTYSSLSTGYHWRLVLGLGAVPPTLSICCLWMESVMTRQRLAAVCCLLLESYHKQLQVRQDKHDTRTEHDAHSSTRPIATQSADPSASTTAPAFLTIATVKEKLREPALRAKLLACGGTWLLYDITFYGLSLLGGAIALSLGAISIVISIYLLPYLSLKYLQLLGFFVQAFFLALLVCLFTYLKGHDSNGLFALYCLALMSLQLGAGDQHRHGKLGAIIGAYTFYYIALASLHAVYKVCTV